MAIVVDKIEDGLPITVVVPHIKSRESFYRQFVYPMLEAQEVNEIITVTDMGNVQHQRNVGAANATQDYLFFCDDDIVLPLGFLETLYDVLKNSSENVGYAYTGYQVVALNGAKNFVEHSREWDAWELTRGNYISTMSLIKAEKFPSFDERIKRLQDWDLWMTMYRNQDIGVFVADLKYMAFQLDKGISNDSVIGFQEAYNAVVQKHGIWKF